MKRHRLHPGDFPDLNEFTDKAAAFSFGEFPKTKPKLLGRLQGALEEDLPRLLGEITQLAEEAAAAVTYATNPFDTAWVVDDAALAKYRKVRGLPLFVCLLVCLFGFFFGGGGFVLLPLAFILSAFREDGLIPSFCCCCVWVVAACRATGCALLVPFFSILGPVCECRPL